MQTARHSTVTAQSQHGHSMVTALSQHSHSTVTAPSQHEVSSSAMQTTLRDTAATALIASDERPSLMSKPLHRTRKGRGG